MNTAMCIGCGCTDHQACWDDETDNPCHWLVVDRDAGLGVCSVCKDHVQRWNAGDRKVAVPVLPKIDFETVATIAGWDHDISTRAICRIRPRVDDPLVNDLEQADSWHMAVLRSKGKIVPSPTNGYVVIEITNGTSVVGYGVFSSTGDMVAFATTLPAALKLLDAFSNAPEPDAVEATGRSESTLEM